MKISEHITDFLKKQRVMVVSTLDDAGRIHCAVKGIVEVNPEGQIFLIDLFSGRTFRNLEKRSEVSLTAVDKDKFMGYTIQGKATIHSRMGSHDDFISKWQDLIIQRISDRIVNNIRSGKRSKEIFETKLLTPPQHLVEVEVENIIDLSPDHLSPQEVEEKT